MEDSFSRLREAELIHGRWAMLGALGCLSVELAGQGSWIDAPKWAVTGGLPSYLGIEFNENLATITIIEITLMAFVESQRGAAPDLETRMYPGGTFDPLGFAKEGGDKLIDLKEKEIANGRLAMVAMLGFFAQVSLSSHLDQFFPFFCINW